MKEDMLVVICNPAHALTTVFHMRRRAKSGWNSLIWVNGGNHLRKWFKSLTQVTTHQVKNTYFSITY